MTKTQIRSQLRKLLERLSLIKDDLQDLENEVEETRDNIEPYGDAYELTEAQEEKQEWCDDLAYEMQNLVDNIEEGINEIEDKLEW